MILDRIPRIVHGPGSLEEIGRHIPVDWKSGPILLVADSGLHSLGLIAEAEAALRAEGHAVVLFDAFKSDPTVQSIDEGVDLARAHKIGAVVALGGGSALDVGKAIASVASGDLPTADYALCAKPLPANPLPKICVPTTAGTGSETTRTVVASLSDGTKTWLWGDALKADLVVLDPVLTTALPPALTAATGIDAFVHALEAATNRNASLANNIHAHAAIRLVRRHLLRALEAPADLDARGGLQWAAALAGMAIDNAGTAIGHAIGHALASLRPIHHGRAVGLAVLATLAWNTEADEEGHFAAVAEAFGEKGGAAALAPAFERMLRESGIKVSLQGEGHDAMTAEALVAKMRKPENMPMLRANRRQPTDQDLFRFAERILRQA